MAKIKDAKPKNSSGGYERLVGDEKLASLLKKAQSTVITNGTELEKIVQEMATTVIDDLDSFIDNCKHKKTENGIYLCPKKIAKKSKYGKEDKEPDLILFILTTDEDICYVIELKDGHVFDTKKSRSEKENIVEYVNSIASEVPFLTKGYICCFNQLNKDEIVVGLKNEFNVDEVMTGQELCNLMNISYKKIIKRRQKDREENFDYFIDEICAFVETKNNVINQFREHILSDDFYSYDDEE